ncbi:MAG: Gfo/Idh/MocA family oxidoreductase [Alphaproteobacteria bacterium]|jgi:predicted dehydrogenase
MDKVRVGLIGAGSIGVRHMKAMEEVPEITLVAIADPSPAAVRIGAAQNIPIYPDAGAMLAQGGLDAVIIATPTERHHQDMMMALEARQTVLVEKPITATLAEADEVTRFAEQQGCHVLVGHQRRYYPCAAEAREIIAQGRIGKLMGVTGQWTTRKDDDYYSAAWRRDVKAGPILTNLIHEIDLLRFICGDIATVSAEVTHHDQEFDKEDAVAISMKFVNSAVGTFLLSDRTPTPWTWEMALGESVRFPKTGQNAIRFLGTEGALDFPNLTLWSHADSDGDWHDEITAEQIKTPFVDAYIAQCRHLCAIVRGTETPIIDARNGSKSLAATLAAASSAASGRRVILEQ